jgi:photosystem II stability/assembly factor-like uncharacterized protein
MRIPFLAWAVVVLACAAACGGSSGPGNTATPEGGTMSDAQAYDAESGPLADADAAGSLGDGDAATTRDGGDAAACPASWTRFEDGLAGGSINEVGFDPRSPGAAYAAGDFRVFAVGASGTSQQVGESPFPIHKLAFPPNAPAQTILGASYGGLLQSTDGGATWTMLALSGELLTTMLLDPAQPQRLYVGTIGGGIWRSDDGGGTWFAVNNGVPYGQVFALAGDPQDADVVIASIAQLTPQGGWTGYGEIIRTADGGKSWAVSTTPMAPMTQTAADIETCTSNPNIVFAAIGNGLLKSVDGGMTFPQTFLAGKDIASVGIDSSCNTVYAYAYNDAAYQSIDGGMTWSPPLTNGLMLTAPTTVHPLAIDPAHADHVLAGSQAGLFETTNGGMAWSLVHGAEAIAAGDLSVSPLEPDRLWMATGGTGLWTRTTTGGWQQPMGKAGSYDFAILADGNHQNRVLAGAEPGLWVSNDDGAMFSDLYSPENIFAIATDPTNPQILYAGGEVNGLFVTTDDGAHWTQSNGTLTAWPTSVGVTIWIGALLVDPATPTHVIMGTFGRGLYLSTDSAGSWNPVAPAASTSVVSCLVGTSKPSAAFYACAQGLGVLKSIDGGSTWSTLTTGLTSLDVTKLTVDPATGDLYATTQADGVFRSTDQGATWKAFEPECLPTRSVQSGIAVVKGGAGNELVVTGSGGVFAHPL